MRRLANSSSRRRSQARIRQLPSRIVSYTTTTFGAITTPDFTLQTPLNGVPFYFWVDLANDWTGDSSDYTVSNLVITNTTTSGVDNVGAVTGSGGGTIATLRFIGLGTYNLTGAGGSPAGHNGGGNNTFRFTGTVHQAGYEDAAFDETITIFSNK